MLWSVVALSTKCAITWGEPLSMATLIPADTILLQAGPQECTLFSSLIVVVEPSDCGISTLIQTPKVSPKISSFGFTFKVTDCGIV